MLVFSFSITYASLWIFVRRMFEHLFFIYLNCFKDNICKDNYCFIILLCHVLTVSVSLLFGICRVPMSRFVVSPWPCPCPCFLGSDYYDTFSPVVKMAYIRLLLFMAAMRSWPLFQLEIKNAFLHGNLAEEIYMEQPFTFVAQGKSGLVCRLHRYLYGLKQSP